MAEIFDKEQISNICETCLENKEILPALNLSEEILLTDTGFCNECKKGGDVLDLPLLKIYANFGLSPKMIHTNLPRLRQSYPRKIPLTLDDITIIAERAQIYDKNCEQVKKKLLQQEPLAKDELEFILSVIDDNSDTWIVSKIDQATCDKLKVGQPLSEDEFHKMETIFEYGIRNWQRPESQGKRA
jgi:hypothetical protein